MSIRITLLLLLTAFLSIYAWKNWFVSLCGAILLMAVIQHPDFPQSIAGIQGANPWNLLFLSITLAWAARRGDEGHEWDLPPIAGRMLLACLAVVVVGVIRLLLSDYPTGYTILQIVSEFFVNPVKWVITSLLLFDACRTRRRAVIALGIILGVYFLLAAQIIRWMPLSSIGDSGSDFTRRSYKICQNEVGYNRVTLSMMLAGASWAVLAAVPILKQNLHRFILLAVAGVIVLGQSLTGGRTGYVTWLAVGLLLAVLRWRKLLLLIPVALLVIGIGMPSVRERMLQGFGGKEGNFAVSASADEMTSGRVVAWPAVIEKIWEAPLTGYGRLGMKTTGTTDYLGAAYGEPFPHPHQAYLEFWLDNGIVGLLLIVSFFLYVVRHSLTSILVRNDPLICAIGCTAFCLVLALMIGAFGGQTFYPREGSIGMWAAIALLLRVHVNSLYAQDTGESIFPDELPGKWFVNTLDDDVEDEEWTPGNLSPDHI